MSTHSVMLRGGDRDECLAVECLGRVLSRYKDALPDWEVSVMANNVWKYDGTFGFSDEFTDLNRLAEQYGVLWDIDSFGYFTVSF